MQWASTRHSAKRLRGFTLGEAAISTVVVAVMMGAALGSVARTGQFRRISNELQMAHGLGEQLMAEILCKSYWDPSSSSPTAIGPSAAEAATGNRSKFNDVDDFHGWIECPLQSPDGSTLGADAGWYRWVQVSFVHWSNLEATVGSDQGLKRIRVEVGRVRPGGSTAVVRDRRPVATLVAIAGRGRGV